MNSPLERYHQFSLPTAIHDIVMKGPLSSTLYRKFAPHFFIQMEKDNTPLYFQGPYMEGGFQYVDVMKGKDMIGYISKDVHTYIMHLSVFGEAREMLNGTMVDKLLGYTSKTFKNMLGIDTRVLTLRIPSDMGTTPSMRRFRKIIR